MEYAKETVNELANKIAMAISINNETFNNELKKIFINYKAFAILQNDPYYYHCYCLHREGDDTLFGYPAQVYYDNKDEPEFYLGI